MEQDLQQTLLQQLRDIHTPAEVSWWPPAIGWWILLLLLLFAGIFAIWGWWQNYRKNRYRKLAITELETLFSQWKKHQDAALFVQKTNALLKRTVAEASACAEDEQVMSLSGQGWITLLNRCTRTPFTENSATALARAGYEPNPEVDIPELKNEVTHWIQHHRPATALVDNQGEPSHA